MKRIIDRKTYDTETAELLAESENQSAYPGGFEYWEEGLYRTAEGAFFIAGSGGAMTHYSKSAGDNSYTGSSNLRVVGKDEAIDWLEANGHTDALEKHFGNELEEG